jgi:hypothetical protein
MPIALNANCKNSLIRALADALPTIQIKNGMFIDWNSTSRLRKLDSIIPQQGGLRSLLTEYIGDRPISSFTIDTLQRQLLELDRYQQAALPTPLNERIDLSNPQKIAESIIAQFESLPWRYTLTVQLPLDISNFFSETQTVRDFGPNMRVVSASQVTDEFPLATSGSARLRQLEPSANALLPIFDGSRLPLKWPERGTLIQLEASGFVDPFGLTAPCLNAEHRLKSFLGLGIALFLFRSQYTWSPWPFKSQIYVHKHTGAGWELENRLDVEDDKSRALNSIRVDTETLGSPELIKAWAPIAVKKISGILSAGPPAQNILLACQWLYDAHTARDELLQYINAMVVLEILLGEEGPSDNMSLGELLRNRCAYLIGRNRKQRGELLRDFQRIYRVRSQILHRGKPLLSHEERSLLWRLRWICQQVIQKEVELLNADPRD